MKNTTHSASLAVLLGLAFVASPTHAWKQKYTEPVSKYPTQGNINTALDNWWDNWKTRFLNGGLVKATDPNGNAKFVSEAQSYGMLLSVWMNDQATFNFCYAKAQSLFWNKDHYGWLLNDAGTSLSDGNFAGDADQDIAGALIFASILVDKGYWNATYPGGAPAYKAQASTILQYTGLYSGGNVCSWNGQCNTLNPSYHMPAWYPVFKDFCAKNSISTSNNWDAIRAGAYSLFNAQHSPVNGFARNWSTSSGGTAFPGTGSKPSEDAMGFDAIRVPWRIGLDAIWYRYKPALDLIKATWTAGMVNAATPGMYSNSATLWSWCDGSGCANEYERVLTRSMWGANAVAGQDSSTAAHLAANQIYADMGPALSYNYVGDYQALASNPKDVDKNYYTQSVAIMGMMAMTGNAPNIWDDLNYTWVPVDTSTKVTTQLKATPDSVKVTVKGDTGKTRLTAAFGKAVKWTIYAKGRTSLQTKIIVAPAAKTTLDTTWWTSTMTAGEVADVKVYWPTCKDTTRTTIRIVAPNTGVYTRASFQIPGMQRLDGSLLHVAENLSDEAIQQVRFLDAKGAVIATMGATKTAEGVRLDRMPSFHGISFFEVVTHSFKFQGRVFRI